MYMYTFVCMFSTSFSLSSTRCRAVIGSMSHVHKCQIFGATNFCTRMGVCVTLPYRYEGHRETQMFDLPFPSFVIIALRHKQEIFFSPVSFFFLCVRVASLFFSCAAVHSCMDCLLSFVFSLLSSQGAANGLDILDVTDVSRPTRVKFIPGCVDQWRDFKVHHTKN